MFRRRAQEPPADTGQSSDSESTATDGRPKGTPSKGRPTPKRSDAERGRRRPVTAPRSRKQAYKQMRERQAEQRRRSREGLLRGDERYLHQRDRGPVRKFARDWIDGRRLIGEYFMYLIFVFLFLNFVPNNEVRLASVPAMYLMLVAVVVQCVWAGQKVKRLAREKFPDESVKGVAFYAGMRSMQIRRLRFPPPAVGPGGAPVKPKR